MVDVTLYLGDCLNKLPLIETASVDAVITDSPYPCIKRDYGYWTVEEWWALIVEGVVPEVRRILKPTGSAVFILQPNSEHVGQMRGWLWEFMAWVCREWNLIRDVYWWNYAALPSGEGVRRGLPKLTVKTCVWCGFPSCYRKRSRVMWKPSQQSLAHDSENRALQYRPSGCQTRESSFASSMKKNKGSVPPNLLPFANSDSRNKHGASTPLKLADWWTRYICPPGGTVCDPFAGSGTMGVAAVQNGCNFIGIEKLDKLGYFPTAQKRIAEAQEKAKEPQQARVELRNE